MRRSPDGQRVRSARRHRSLRLVHPSIQELERRQLLAGASIHVSDLPFVSASNDYGPVERDQTNGANGAHDGQTISLRGVTYSKGLGTHANSDVKIALDGIYDRFHAVVGVDDDAGGYGTVVFQVWADGAKLYDSGVVGGGTPSSEVNVDVRGKLVLDLIVTDAGDGFNNDHADWADAQLRLASSDILPGDASFEDVALGDGVYTMAPTGSAWSFTGSAGIAGYGSGWSGAYGEQAPDGRQAALLQGSTASISQVVTGWAAGFYRIAFSASQAGYVDQNFEVLIDNVNVGSYRPTYAKNQYERFTTAEFTVPAGRHAITFRAINSSGGANNAALIDDVAIESFRSPDPSVGDGSFEAVDVGPLGYEVNPRSGTWTFQGPAGVALNQSAIAGSNPASPSGGQVGFLQKSGSFTQTAVGWLGGPYQVVFSAAQRASNSANRNLEVLVDGNVVGTFSPSGTSYQTYATPTFTVAAGQHVVSFRAPDTGSGNDFVLIDDVEAGPVRPAILLDSGGSNTSRYDGGFILLPYTIRSGEDMNAYLAAHPIVADPVFDAHFTPTSASYPAWFANDADSSWMGATPGGMTPASLVPFLDQAANFNPDSVAPQGLYYYSTKFFVPAGADPHEVLGQWAIDNTGMAIFLNGVPQNGFTNDGIFFSFSTFHLDPAALRVGMNTLTFVNLNGTYNSTNGNPSGMRIKATLNLGLPLTPTTTFHSLSGRVFADANNDGKIQPGEPGLAGVTVALAGVDTMGNSVNATTRTGTDGSYSFAGLAPGTYSVAETHPTGLIDGKVNVGLLGGVTGVGRITGITLSNADAVGYNFGLDRPPTFIGIAPSEVQAGNTYVYKPVATDPDNDSLNFTWLAGPVNGIYDSAGQVQWTTTAADLGTKFFTVRVDDGRGGTDQRTFAVEVISTPNRPPIFTSTPVVDAFVGEPYLYQATAFDPDSDPLTFRTPYGFSLPGTMTFTAGGTLQWTPTKESLGPHLVHLVVDDQRGGTSESDFTVVVRDRRENLPPVILSQPITELKIPQAPAFSAPGPEVVYTVLGKPGEPVAVTFSAHGGNTAYNDSIGFYKIDDAMGRIGTMLPGDQGYAQAAFSTGNYQPLFDNDTPDDTNRRIILHGGDHIAFYLIQNSTTDAFRLNNPTNSPYGSPRAFFSYKEANTDNQAKHLVVYSSGGSGPRILGWEDLNDFDYNDIAFSVDAGAIPDYTSAPYTYLVHAFDPDNDPVTYALLPVAGEPTDASIDPHTGLLTWAARPGTFHFSVEARDDHGNVSAPQVWTLTVANNDTVQILGSVFHDYDGNRTHDPDEAGLPGATVYLDANGNGSLDAGELTAISDLAGNYAFRDLPATGTYTVSQVVPTGYYATAPTAGFYVVSSTGPQIYYARDFGDQRFSEVNAPPLITSTPPSDAYVGVLLRYDVAATDSDGDTLTFGLAGQPDGMSIDPVTGSIFYKPDDRDIGSHDPYVIVRDSRGGIAVQPIPFRVNPFNHAPVITSTPGRAIAGVPYVANLAATDADGDPVHFSLSGNNIPNGLSIVGSQLVWNSPSVNPAGYPLVLTANDGRGGFSDPLNFSLVVNPQPGVDSPCIAPDYRSKIQLGHTYYYQVQAKDPAGYALVLSLTNPQGLPVTITPTGLVTWTPVALGTFGFDVVATNGLAAPQVQHVSIEVLPEFADQSPVITSTSLTPAVANHPYRFSLQGFDPDHDPLEWLLDDAPTGMAIDSAKGLLLWTPTVAQIGDRTLSVRLRDGQGGVATRQFSFTVRGTNLPPQFRPNYPPPATQNVSYTFQVGAYDPEDGPLGYELLAAPGGSLPSDLSIDGSGLIHWTNPTTSPLSIIVRVKDDQGSYASQPYTLTVRPQAPSAPPVIDGSRLLDRAAVGSAYVSFVTATAPNNHPVDFTLGSNHPTNLTITAGEINWTPGTNQYSTLPTTVPVTLIATDRTTGATASLTYRITVRSDNQKPSVSSLGATTLVAQAPLVVQAKATDPDGDPVRWSLAPDGGTPIPAGMTIDPITGRINWIGTDQLRSYSVKVVATDPFGLTDEQTLTVNVIADTTNPTVQVVLSRPSPVVVGTRVTVVVSASDDAGVASRTLTVNGVAVVLDANNAYSFLATQQGQVTFAATATDLNQRMGSSSAILEVFAVSASAPQAELLSYRDAVTAGSTPHQFQPPTTVTAPVEIFGTAGGANSTSPVAYKLEVWSLDGVLLKTLRDQPSSTPVTNGSLGTFDPTMLANGSYVLRLTVSNGSFTKTDEQVMNVTGRLKLGNLHLSFVDLVVPVAGIPITLTRSYDTLNADRKGDFGYGWTLDEGDFQLQVSQPDGSLAGLDVHTPFTLGTHIVLTRPGMEPEGFTFLPETVTSGYFALSSYARPRFVADPGVTDQLTVPDVELLALGDGTYASLYDVFTPYNPADPIFGGNGQFTLTTRQGLAYVLDADSGRLASVTDRNGNTLTYDDLGIYSSTGREVKFHRNADGLIDQITDPRGNVITYSYDNGNLIGMANRQANAYAAATQTIPVQTTFFYKTDPAHFLDHIVDPFGRTVAQATYAADDRLSGLTDVNGQMTTLGYNLATLNQSITPPDINGVASQASTIRFDTFGNPIEAIDALGHSSSATYVATPGSTQKTNLETQSQVVNGHTVMSTYAYNADGTVKSSTDVMGRTTYYSYGGNKFGLPEFITDPMGNTTQIGYDQFGNTNFTRSPGGIETTTTYTKTGQVETSTTPGGQTTRYTYNEFGDVHTVTDAHGTTTTYDYDYDGNQISSSWTWVGKDSAGMLQSRVMETHNDYDAEDRLIRSIGPDGMISNTVYDAAGRAEWVDDPHLTGEKATGTHTIYDAAGRVIRTEQFRNVVITVSTLGGVTTNDYVSHGNAISVSSTVYDARGQAIWSDDAHLPGQPTNGTRTIYNADGTVQSTQRYANVVIAVTPDPNGTPTTQISGTPAAIGSASTTVYDAAGRVESTTSNGHTVTYGYDDAGHQTSVTDTVEIHASGGGTTTAPRTTTSTYDAAGRLETTTDALGHTTRFVHDADGRVTTTIFADGTKATTVYDAKTGRKMSATDPDGRTTTYTYTDSGELKTVTLPEVQDGNLLASGQYTVPFVAPVYTYHYDDYGNLDTQTDPLGHTTTYRYDAFGRKVWERLPDGTLTKTWAYDDQGRLESTTDYNGQIVSLEYDDLDRVETKRTFASATATNATNSVTYAYDLYDASNRRYDTVTVSDTAAFNANDVTASYYNSQGQLVEITKPGGGSVSYEYDPATGQKRRTYTGSSNSPTTDIGYDYDALGRLRTVTTAVLNGVHLTDALVTSYYYDVNDNLVATADANGSTEYRTYDSLNRLTAVETVSATGTILAGFSYTLGKSGQRKSMIDDTGRPVTVNFGRLGRCPPSSRGNRWPHRHLHL